MERKPVRPLAALRQRALSAYAVCPGGSLGGGAAHISFSHSSLSSLKAMAIFLLGMVSLMSAPSSALPGAGFSMLLHWRRSNCPVFVPSGQLS